MNEGLVFKIGADITQFSASISDVEKELKTLRDTLKTATGQAIVDTNKNIAALEQTLVNLKKTGLDKLPAAAANGTAALSSLGNVAKDLPFGFIAIQNNIPAVFESFSALTKQSGSVGNALKSLFSTLAGPAGIAFGVGVVTAGVTALIQKYGSLSKAIDVIFASNQQLAKLQLDFNKAIADTTGNLAAENAKVDILTKSLLNNQTPQKDRIAAYNELKKVAPDVVAGIKEENIGTQASNILIEANASLRQQSIRLKIQEAGINEVLAKNSADRAQAEFTLNELSAKRLALIEKIRKNEFKPTPTNQFDIRISQLSELEAQIVSQAKVVDNLYGIENKYLKQLEPVTLGITNINEQTRLRIQDLKDQEKKEQEAADALKRGANAAKSYKYELQSLKDIRLSPKQLNVQSNIDKLQELANIVLNVTATEKKRAEALKQLQAIDPKLFQGLTTQKGSYEALKAAIDVLNEGYLIELDYYNRIAKSEPIVDKFALANQGLKEFNQNLFNTIQVYDRETAKLKPIGVTITQTQGKLTPTPETPIVPPALPSDISDIINKFAADTNKAKLVLDDFKKQANLTAAYNLINDTFFSPLQDLFSTFLSTGKLAFADFGKAILKAIQQIVAKIIATGIITLLANIFLPGIGAAGAAGGKAAGGLGSSLLSGIGAAFGFNLGGSVAAPQFAGVGGGTMGMSGSVNVVLRGSDLVGSINRTNATISRVG